MDRYHAKERLHELSKAICRNRNLARHWARQRCTQLDAGPIEDILASLAHHGGSHPEAGTAYGYFQENRHRMRYAKFRSQALCTSSGLLEAGCKNVIGARLKRSGMHWSVRSANQIMALRLGRLSGRFEDFWEWRAHRKGA